MEMEKTDSVWTVKYPKGRKSLAVDYDTYNLLQELCEIERRSKIDQLRFLIEKHDVWASPSKTMQKHLEISSKSQFGIRNVDTERKH